MAQVAKSDGGQSCLQILVFVSIFVQTLRVLHQIKPVKHWMLCRSTAEFYEPARRMILVSIKERYTHCGTMACLNGSVRGPIGLPTCLRCLIQTWPLLLARFQAVSFA